jgi:hypothetical protein
MRQALKKVTQTGGTATLAKVPGYKPPARPAPCQKHNPKAAAICPNSISSPSPGMLPADDPAFVCIVVIDDPRTTKVEHVYGGTIAARSCQDRRACRGLHEFAAHRARPKSVRNRFLPMIFRDLIPALPRVTASGPLDGEVRAHRLLARGGSRHAVRRHPRHRGGRPPFHWRRAAAGSIRDSRRNRPAGGSRSGGRLAARA